MANRKTLRAETGQKASIKKRLADFFSFVSQLISKTLWHQQDAFLDAFWGNSKKRLADFINKISNMMPQQDGMTLSTLKKGHIHMRAHTHTWGQEFTVLLEKRLAVVGAVVR